MVSERWRGVHVRGGNKVCVRGRVVSERWRVQPLTRIAEQWCQSGGVAYMCVYVRGGNKEV